MLYAVSKLLHGNKKVKRHTLMAEAQRTHLENVRTSRHVIELKGDDVPFGVKALESGIEVEGIVISRPATPDSRRSQHTLVGSDNDSQLRAQASPGGGGSQPRHSSRYLVHQPSPYIALPAPALHGYSGMSSLRSSATSIVSVPSGSGSNDAQAAVAGARSLSDPLLQTQGCAPVLVSPPPQSGPSTPRSYGEHGVDPQTLARLEGRHLSVATPNGGHRGKRSSSGPSRPQSRTPTPPDGHRPPSALPSVNEDSAGESSRESDSSVESDGMERPRRPGLVAAHPIPAAPSSPAAHCRYAPDGDLSLLHIHRLSHAAEVGQLLPRNSRTSRMLSGTDVANSASPHSFASPTAVQPVYTFDLALAPAATPAARSENPQPSLAPFPEPAKPFLSPYGRSSAASQFVEELWDQSLLSAEPRPDGNSDIDDSNPSTPVSGPDSDPEERTEKHKAYDRLRKKRGTKASSSSESMDVDLEAQLQS